MEHGRLTSNGASGGKTTDAADGVAFVSEGVTRTVEHQRAPGCPKLMLWSQYHRGVVDQEVAGVLGAGSAQPAP